MFMISLRFIFETYAENVRVKATKCSLKTAKVILVVGGHVLTKV